MSEAFVVDMRCAMDSQAFGVILDRADGSKKWRISRVAPAGAAVSAQNAPSAAETTMSSLDAQEVDWSGWHCPICGYGRNGEGRRFLQCGTCQEFVCGAKVRSVGQDIETYECHPGCEGSGQVSGEMSRYRGALKPRDLLGPPARDRPLPSASSREPPRP